MQTIETTFFKSVFFQKVLYYFFFYVLICICLFIFRNKLTIGLYKKYGEIMM